MWERGSTLRAELSAVDISWYVVARAERAMAADGCLWAGLVMASIVALFSPATRLVQVNTKTLSLESSCTSICQLFSQSIFSLDLYRALANKFKSYDFFLCLCPLRLKHIFFWQSQFLNLLILLGGNRPRHEIWRRTTVDDASYLHPFPRYHLLSRIYVFIANRCFWW